MSTHDTARSEDTADDNVDRINSDGSVSPDQVRNCLHEIVDPCSAATGSNLDIVELGLVKAIDVEQGHVDIEMRLTSPMCHMVPYFMKEVEERVGNLEGVESTELETDDGFAWREEMMSEKARRQRQSVLKEHETRYQREQLSDG